MADVAPPPAPPPSEDPLLSLPLPSRRAVLASLAFAPLGGCSGSGAPPSGTVTGKVTIDGQPLTGGAIRFHPSSAEGKSKASGGVIGADGSYSVPDAPLGACTVTIDTGATKGAATKNSPAAGPGADIMKKMQGPPAGMPAMGGGNGAGFVSGTKPVPIEAAYASPATTPLKADVKRGANAFNFEVK